MIGQTQMRVWSKLGQGDWLHWLSRSSPQKRAVEGKGGGYVCDHKCMPYTAHWAICHQATECYSMYPIGSGFDYSKTGVNRVLTLSGNPVAAPTSLPLLQTSLL